MTRIRRILSLLGVLLAVGCIVIVCKIPSAKRSSEGIVIRHSQYPGWIEVLNDGKLSSEWQKEDGEIYDFLQSLIGDEIEPTKPTFGEVDGKRCNRISV